jgi:hypothetical protein
MRMLGPDGMARANDLESKHISGVPEVSGQQSSRPIPEEDRKRVEAMQVLSNKGKDLLNYAQQNKLNLDKLNPVERQKILAVGAQKAEEMLNFYNNAVQNGGALTKDRLAWYDKQISKNPTSVFQDISGNNDKLKEIINSNEGRKGLLLKSLGFNPKQAAQTKTMNGVQYEKVPGGWKNVQ